MAKPKRSQRSPQARHGKKSPSSRHDRRARLYRRNPNRKPTLQAKTPLVGLLATLTASMGHLLDARIGFRLAIVLAGAMLAGSRRTASRWFACGGVADDWDHFYELLKSLGPNAWKLAKPLCHYIVTRFDPGPEGHWKFAIDDSPTKRFGREVEAANVHRNPTPGPADGEWMYGHNWVSLAVLLKHSMWGVLALPLMSALYVRKCDVGALDRKRGWEFQTKHQLALKLIDAAWKFLRQAGSRAGFVVVADGAYATKEFVRTLLKMNVTLVSRLRHDAKLFDLPPERSGKRGRPRKYGVNRLSLAKRAGRREGWTTMTYSCRGVMETCRCKSFLATSELAGGVIRVVLVKRKDDSWTAYFSTDVAMDDRTIIETAAERWAIEEFFHDVKEVWGAGQQQVRHVWSNVACWHVNGWLYALTELHCWDISAAELVDRSDRSWDNPDRRPSHADRRRYVARKMLENQFLNDLPDNEETTKYRERILSLLRLAA